MLVRVNATSIKHVVVKVVYSECMSKYNEGL